MRLLVGYASRFGSTRDIARRLAAIIRQNGSQVDVLPVEEILDFGAYDGVVLGSGVYDGSWTAEANDLIRRHAPVLRKKPVWLFTVGSFGDRHPVVGALMKKEPREIEEFQEAIRPRDYRVFAGVIDLERWPGWGRMVFKALGGRDGDNRRWPDIDSWAEEIADAMTRYMRRPMAAEHPTAA
jgi:menaquinone-dependent protoporphyrinogen oxidase